MNQIKRILPGLLMSVGVALIANAIEGNLAHSKAMEFVHVGFFVGRIATGHHD